MAELEFECCHHDAESVFTPSIKKYFYVDVWQKPTKFCKAIFLQLKNKFLKTKKTKANQKKYFYTLDQDPQPLGSISDDLRWSWCNNTRNKVHSECNALKSSQNHLPTPVHEKSVFHETTPGRHKGWRSLPTDCISVDFRC